MYNTVAFERSLYFNHISHSIEHGDLVDKTKTGKIYTERAKGLLSSFVRDLDNLLARDYDAVLRSPTHSDVIGITEILGYKDTGNLRKSTKLAKKKRRDLARAVMLIDELSNSPELFYENEDNVVELQAISNSIFGYYEHLLQGSSERELSGDEAL
jgi:hypothetical protein